MTPKRCRARRILTSNRSQPEATQGAVRDGRVLGVGDAESLAGWGPFVVDDRFAHQVLMAGFVEAHSHVSEGGLWRDPSVGFHDRVDPEGRRGPGPDDARRGARGSRRAPRRPRAGRAHERMSG